MDLPSIVAALQRGSALLPRAVQVLFNYSHPLSERESALLMQFAKEQQECLEAGLHAADVPESIKVLTERPLQRLPGAAVVQCVLGAAKIPSFPIKYQRKLQRQLLHRVVKNTPLSFKEWSHILNQAALLPMEHSLTALRCAEEVLKAAAPAVLKKDALDTTDEAWEANALNFLSLFASVVFNYAKRHAGCTKHSLLSLSVTIPRGNENFLSGGPMRRLRRILESICCYVEKSWDTLAPKLAPSNATILSVVAPWRCLVSKEMILQVVKSSSTLLLNILDKRPLPGSMRVAEPDEVLQVCFYNMGLTTCSLGSARDYLAVVMALPEDDKKNYFRTHGEDVFFQLLIPFVNKPNVFTLAVAQDWGDLYSLIFLQAGVEEEFLTTFVRTASEVIKKCRVAAERSSIMTIVSSVLHASSSSSRSTVPHEHLAFIVERDLASPSPDAANAAWKVLQISGVEEEVAGEMRVALKSAKNNPALLTAMALYLSPARAPADVVDGLNDFLINNCEQVDAYRPAAFLALRFLVERKAKISSNLCNLLCQADTLKQLGQNVDEVNALADTASVLANAFIFAPMALLLTHKSGLLRRLLSDCVAKLSGDASSIIALWDSVTHVVFGLECKEKPKILSSAGADSLSYVASALLKHTAKMAVPTALRELVLCCGHDHVQGEDPYYFFENASPLGRARANSKGVERRVFESVFTEEHKHLLTLHHDALVDGLCGHLNDSLHLRTAASRGLVLVMGMESPFAPSQKIFNRVLDAVKQSVNFMLSLDTRDRAIAASSPAAMLEYEDTVLRERQLLKTYPQRPPKGMSEDDFEDIKRRDAVELEKGRGALRKEIDKRRQDIEEAMQQSKTALVTLRTLGTSGSFPLECIEVFFPYLQNTLNGDSVPEVLDRLLVDAITGLLLHTPLGHMSESMARTVARLENKPSLTPSDVSCISTMATHLRQSITKMLPAPLFVVLLPFWRVAFKAGSGGGDASATIPMATQHQLMGVLMQNIGQANLPQPTETLQLLCTILEKFPSLFRTVQQGISLLMSMIPASKLSTLEYGLFNQVDAVKEVTASAYHRFSHFVTCRRALVLAAVFLHDTSVTVVQSMKDVVEKECHSFTLCPNDWNDLVYFLQAYGQKQKCHAARVGMAMHELFCLPSTTEPQQRSWLKDIFKVGGRGSVTAVEVLSPALKGDAYQDVLLYLCTALESPDTEPFMAVVLSCGRVVLHDCTLDVLKANSQALRGHA
uniref:Uncharacterized protein TCIL3000_10_11380 n=1 Tax=Trypanosoma congolense (strain IL3000) TaxID=1068625 RepID=G0UY92_TRYCI|nr:unnamed protein product [Trypanosoma congolense IL3000]